MAEKNGNNTELESKLIPILWEGVEIVKMILFIKLKAYLADRYPERDTSSVTKLTGAVINELFGTPNTEAAFAAFREQNSAAIEETLNAIAVDLEEMRMPLSDALRMAVLLEHQEHGTDNSAILARAGDHNILLPDRDLPLPHRFLDMVRRLGKAFHLIVPPAAEEPS